MSSRLPVGIIGAGLITQVEHLPNLLGLPDLFEVRGVADPSAQVRAHLKQRYGMPVYNNAAELFEQPIDAVVIATPDAYHVELSAQALDRGLHVFCEKPLCYTARDADRLIAKRDTVGRVLQVGYMKRFDPSFLLLRELVRGRGETLRMISVEVNDPDWWPFVAHRDFLPGRDVAAELIREGAEKLSRQVAAAIGRTIEGAQLMGFVNPFCSSMIHDVNLVHGLLDAMGCSTGEIMGSAIFANGEGGLGAVRLVPGDALWTVSHLVVPKLADYCERVTVCFDDRVFQLEFPSPYLNHHPTKLVEKRSKGHHAETIVHRASYHEPFVEEFRAWHAAIVSGGAIVNPIEDARRDMVLLGAMGRVALPISAGTAV